MIEWEILGNQNPAESKTASLEQQICERIINYLFLPLLVLSAVRCQILFLWYLAVLDTYLSWLLLFSSNTDHYWVYFPLNLSQFFKMYRSLWGFLLLRALETADIVWPNLRGGHGSSLYIGLNEKLRTRLSSHRIFKTNIKRHNPLSHTQTNSIINTN